MEKRDKKKNQEDMKYGDTSNIVFSPIETDIAELNGEATLIQLDSSEMIEQQQTKNTDESNTTNIEQHASIKNNQDSTSPLGPPTDESETVLKINRKSTPTKKKRKYTYLCKYEKGCKKVAKAGGFCIAHGGGKKCVVPNCTKVSRYAGSLCHVHRSIDHVTLNYALQSRERQRLPSANEMMLPQSYTPQNTERITIPFVTQHISSSQNHTCNSNSNIDAVTVNPIYLQPTLLTLSNGTTNLSQLSGAKEAIEAQPIVPSIPLHHAQVGINNIPTQQSSPLIFQYPRTQNVPRVDKILDRRFTPSGEELLLQIKGSDGINLAWYPRAALQQSTLNGFSSPFNFGGAA